jgi:beta-glucanase (GH16 family)
MSAISRRHLLLGGAATVGARAGRTLHLPSWAELDDVPAGEPPIGSFAPTGDVLLGAWFTDPHLDPRFTPTWRGGYRGRTSTDTVSWFKDSQVHMTGNACQLIARPATPADQVPAGYEWVSGIMTTREAFGPGIRVEVTARFPRGPGLWPTIALFPRGWPPEIDLAEVINSQPTTVHATYHWRQESDGTPQQAGSGCTNIDVTKPHTYAVDWFPGFIVWYIDGVPFFTQVNPPAALPPIIPTCPLYLTIGLVVGGTGSWAGPTGPSTPDPAIMRVDSVVITSWNKGVVA